MPENTEKLEQLTGLKTNKIFLYIIYLALFGLFIYLLGPYFALIVIAYIYCLLLSPVFEFFRRKLNKGVSIFLTMLTSIFIVLIPLIFLITVSVSQLSEVVSETANDLELGKIGTVLTQLENSINTFIPDETNLQVNLNQLISTIVTTFSESIINSVGSIGASVAAFFVNVTLLFFLVIYMLPSMSDSPRSVRKFLPIDMDLAYMYVTRTNELIRSSFRAIVVIALVQGFLAGLMFSLLDVPYAMLLTFLVMFFSAIPMFGTSIVMVPASILLILSGDVVSGLILLFWQMLVVGTIDNILRPKLLSGSAKNLSEIAMLLTIFGGTAAFGVMGILYGPIIYMLLVSTVEVINEKKGVS